MKQEYELLGYARLVEAVIKDAFQARTMESREKVKEFAKREPNPLISAYCDAFEIDETHVRNALTRAMEMSSYREITTT